MKELLSVELDLRQLYDTSMAPALPSSLLIRAQHVAREANLACALIGSPRFSGNRSNVEHQDCPASQFISVWKQFGNDAPKFIHGGFAAVVIDAHQRCVYLAVDRFSIQTLCYKTDGNYIGISDRADCVPGRKNVIDTQAIFDYLYFHVIPAPRTIFRDVQRLPASFGLLVNNSGEYINRHSHINFVENKKQNFSSARKEFLSIVNDSVKSELNNEAQVGAFLSGGTDSSTVAGMLCNITGMPAPTYSIGFESEGYDEMEFARIAAKHFGCRHREYYVTPSDLFNSIPAVAKHHDQPFGNSSALPSFYCAQMAKADGCSKILAGDGGDELFGGNSRYAVQQVFELYHSVPESIRHAIEPLCKDESVLRRIPLFRQATGYVRHSRTPMPDRLHSFNLLMSLGPTEVLSADLLSQIDLLEPARHMKNTWSQCEAHSLVNKMLAFDWKYTLADSDLPKVRGATDMAGIRVAFPLLSDQLVDFSMTLPANWKLRRFKLRWFFKEALRDFLPNSILKKKKHGFGLPYGPWMEKDQKLRKLAKESLYGLADRGIVKKRFVEHLLDHQMTKHPGYYGEMVWILMMLEQWIIGQNVTLKIE